MTSIPSNKNELHEAIANAYRLLQADYQTIPDALSRIAAIEGNRKGTHICVCDTLAYLIGWGRLVLKWHGLSLAGQPIDFPETGYKWNQLGLLAQHFHREYQHWSYSSLQTELAEVVEQILALIEGIDNSALYGEPWYNKWTLGRMIQLNTASPMKSTRQKIRRFKRAHATG